MQCRLIGGREFAGNPYGTLMFGLSEVSTLHEVHRGTGRVAWIATIRRSGPLKKKSKSHEETCEGLKRRDSLLEIGNESEKANISHIHNEANNSTSPKEGGEYTCPKKGRLGRKKGTLKKETASRIVFPPPLSSTP